MKVYIDICVVCMSGDLTFPSLFRFRLHFEKESKEDVEKGKKLAREKVLQPVSENALEIGIDNIYPPDKGLSVGLLYCF